MLKRPLLLPRRSIVGVFLLSLGLLLAGAAVFLQLHPNSSQPVSIPGAVTSEPTPSSVKPKDQEVAAYTVPSGDPKYISIPAIDTGKLRVLKLGLLSNGSIAVPDNIYDAGWYDGSVRPGQQGTVFMYGHVSSWKANGAFYNLKKLSRGQEITVTSGDDTRYTYRVVETKVYPHDRVNMDQVLTPIDAGKPGLNLMTCTGKIIKGTNDFDERLVVFASLVTK